GDRLIGEVLVPLLGRELAGHDGGALAVAVLEDLEQVAAFLVASGAQAPVVDDEDVDACELGEEADVATVGAREAELVKETRRAAVDRAVAASTRLLRERAGDVRLADAGRARDDHVLVLVHPAARGELADDGLVQLAPRRVVDVLDARLAESELGLLEQPAETLVLEREVLGVDQQAEALVERQLADLGALLLLGPRRTERVEAQRLEFLDGRFVQHGFSPQL